LTPLTLSLSKGELPLSFWPCLPAGRRPRISSAGRSAHLSEESRISSGWPDCRGWGGEA